ncbi:hypothetical protein PWT90_01030 [Aphanocladium album]|nr:hypothetical protein PWT90_01030 [Aphanocladium album]
MPLPYRYKSDYCRTLPTDFIFYVTARLGPKGRHYALAVVSRRGKHDFSAMDVVKACVSIGRRLSCQANRAAIEGELNSRGISTPETPRRIVERRPPWSNECTAEEEEEEERDARDAKPSWCRGHGERNWEKPVEFPFIATSLLLGLGCDEDDGVALEPLGLTLDPNLGGLGMAVVYISDLDRVRHGVVAYWTSTLAPVEREPMVDYDFSDEDDFDDDTAYEYMWLNEERETYSKLPLTARQYCAKAGRPVPESLWNDEEGRSAMEEWRALENGVLRYEDEGDGGREAGGGEELAGDDGRDKHGGHVLGGGAADAAGEGVAGQTEERDGGASGGARAQLIGRATLGAGVRARGEGELGAVRERVVRGDSACASTARDATCQDDCGEYSVAVGE